jgi:hypothetical protein
MPSEVETWARFMRIEILPSEFELLALLDATFCLKAHPRPRGHVRIDDPEAIRAVMQASGRVRKNGGDFKRLK